jgi:cytidyltransferase-like protein
MAHKSLSLKLKARGDKVKINFEKTELKASTSIGDFTQHIQKDLRSRFLRNSEHRHSVDFSNLLNNANEETKPAVHPNYENAEMKMVDYKNDEITEQDFNFVYKKPRNLNTEDENGQEFSLLDSSFVNKSHEFDKKVDIVYTIGCFDLFHQGHVQLIKRMRELGRKIIVGVHDSKRYNPKIYSKLIL